MAYTSTVASYAATLLEGRKLRCFLNYIHHMP